MKLRLYGSLKKKYNSIEYRLEETMPVLEFVKKLNIPREEIKLVMVNHRPVLPDSPVEPDDAVALFPMEYVFFADWKDYWREYAE